MIPPTKVKGFAHFVFGNAAAPRGINGVLQVLFHLF